MSTPGPRPRNHAARSARTGPVPISAAEPCCPEFATMSRRSLMRAGALTGATTVFGSAVVTRATPAYAEEYDYDRLSDVVTQPARNVLVVLSLRGAADGLSLVVPHGDPVYAKSRPRIAIPTSSLLARDDQFGLHPELKAILPLWRSGRLAAVHATGLPAPNRSHFSAMEEVEDADPGSGRRVGWLNRLIGDDNRNSPLQAIAVGDGLIPTSLFGPQRAMAASNVEGVAIAGDDQWDTDNRRPRSLARMWGSASGTIGGGVRAALDSVADFVPATQGDPDPQNGAAYPYGDLGEALASVARIIRGNIGTEVFTVDHGDWDMHTDMGTLEWGLMRANTKELADAIAAFFTDLGAKGTNVTLVTISEFGRRVEENASGGTDHGYGNVMFLAGAGVKGGRYVGRWPGLTQSLDADLRVTTDYRSVLAEVVKTRFGASTAKVFPNFKPEKVGVMRA